MRNVPGLRCNDGVRVMPVSWVEHGERPVALHGWPLEWSTDPRTGHRVLRCGGVVLGWLTHAQLAAPEPTIEVDWNAVARGLGERR